MNDAELRTLRRQAESVGDGPTWLRLAQALARAGHGDGAGQAALIAGSFVDASTTLDDLTPSLDELQARPIDSSALAFPRRHSWRGMGRIRWTPDGSGLIGQLDTNEGSNDSPRDAVAIVDVPSGQRRLLVRSSSERHIFANGTPAALRADGRILAFSCLAPRELFAIATVGMSASGATDLRRSKRVGRNGHDIEELVLTASNLLLCQDRHRTRVFRLDATGAPTRGRAHWVFLYGNKVHLDPTGACVRCHGNELELYDPGSRTPRAKIHVTGYEDFLPIGRRVVIVDDLQATLLGPDCAVLGRIARPQGFHDPPSPSASGRLLAFYSRGTARTWDRPGTSTVALPDELRIADLRSGAVRTFPLAGRPTDALWSPSGRKLLTLVQGPEHLLVEAP